MAFQAPRHYIINSYKTFAVGADEGRGQHHGRVLDEGRFRTQQRAAAADGRRC